MKDKLQELFEISDDLERQKALVEYATKLKINVLKAKGPDGDFNENELAVLIYDAQQGRKTRKFENIGLLVAALFIMAIIGAAIFIFIFMTQQPAVP